MTVARQDLPLENISPTLESLYSRLQQIRSRSRADSQRPLFTIGSNQNKSRALHVNSRIEAYFDRDVRSGYGFVHAGCGGKHDSVTVGLHREKNKG
jgi:hypothetical protein